MSDKNNDKVQSFKFMGKLGAFKNFASVSRKKVKSFFLSIFSGEPVRTYLKSETSNTLQLLNRFNFSEKCGRTVIEFNLHVPDIFFFEDYL